MCKPIKIKCNKIIVKKIAWIDSIITEGYKSLVNIQEAAAGIVGKCTSVPLKTFLNLLFLECDRTKFIHLTAI